jgi:hypothetical protein
MTAGEPEAAPPSADTTGDEPTWIDTFKELTRPAGCWFAYLSSTGLIATICVCMLKQIPPDIAALTAAFGFEAQQYTHVWNYTTSRSREKLVGKD